MPYDAFCPWASNASEEHWGGKQNTGIVMVWPTSVCHSSAALWKLLPGSEARQVEFSDFFGQ